VKSLIFRQIPVEEKSITFSGLPLRGDMGTYLYFDPIKFPLIL